MYNEECASIILRTADLTANQTTNIGTADAYLTNMVWSNINLRTVLGAMYDKFDKFALVPVSFQSVTGAATFGNALDDRIVALNIAGLPFTNNVYNSNSKTNVGSAVFNVVKFQTSISISSTPGNILMFTKNQELVNLNIFYQRVSKNGNNPATYDIVQGVSPFPDCIFTFNIYGIDKHDRVADLNSSRMFN